MRKSCRFIAKTWQRAMHKEWWITLTKPRKKKNEYTPPDDTLQNLALIGGQLEGANLSGYSLRGVDFTNANLRGANLERADLTGANFTRADLSRANLYLADFTRAKFAGADMTMSYGRGTLFRDCDMSYTMLRRVTYKNCFFIDCNLEGVDVAGAFLVGTRFNECNTLDMRNVTGPHGAVFVWYLRPGGGPARYKPAFRYVPYATSVTGTLTVQENSARRKMT